MPADFEKKLNGLLAEKGASLEMSEETRGISSGFVLVYGGIEENCGIKAIFDSMKEELSDQVNRMLFG